MKINQPLDEILGNASRLQIMRLFFKYPGSFSGRHVARLCNLPVQTTKRHLDVLEANNVVGAKQYGKSKVFTLNKKNILYRPLRQIFLAEEKVLREIKDITKKAIKESQYLRNRLAHASFYGSIVEKRETAQSDIDLFLVFKDDFNEHMVNKQFENAADIITTISGSHLHWHPKSIDDLNKLNKQFLNKVKKASLLLYGKNIEELKRG